MSGTKKKLDIVIIGSDANGLAAAMLLARAGRSVLVLEPRKVLGGTAAEEEFFPGFKVPGTLHGSARISPEYVTRLELAKFDLDLFVEEPSVLAPQRKGEGKGLLLNPNPGKIGKELVGVDFQRYGEYKAFLDNFKPLLNELFHEAPPSALNPSFFEALHLGRKALALRMLGKKLMAEFLRMPPMCVADLMNEWFQSDLLKSVLAAPAIYGTYTGPWSPGSCANLMLHECIEQRTVKGGASNLIKALEASALEQGAQIRTSSPIRKIKVTAGTASGVVLESGEEILAERVLSASDPKRTFLNLIDSRELSYRLEKRITDFRSRGTTAKIHLALKGELRFACRHEHGVEFARTGEHLDDLERAFDAVKYGQFSKKPLLDIFVPTVSRGDLAPMGHSVVSIMVHFAPYNLRGGWSDDRKDEFGARVMEVLEQYCPGVGDQAIGGEILSPIDLETRYGLTGGHIHQGEIALDQLLARPIPDCAQYSTPIRGLYLCGDGSHPGGVVTCGPGVLCAESIIAAGERVAAA